MISDNKSFNFMLHVESGPTEPILRYLLLLRPVRINTADGRTNCRPASEPKPIKSDEKGRYETTLLQNFISYSVINDQLTSWSKTRREDDMNPVGTWIRFRFIMRLMVCSFFVFDDVSD